MALQANFWLVLDRYLLGEGRPPHLSRQQREKYAVIWIAHSMGARPRLIGDSVRLTRAAVYQIIRKRDWALRGLSRSAQRQAWLESDAYPRTG